MFNRTVRTRLPTVRSPVSTEPCRRQERMTSRERLKRKEVRDERRTVQEKQMKAGEKVLVAQRKIT